MRQLEGKAFVVTGAASGIGRAIALECVRQGASIAYADVDEGLLEAAVEEGLAVGRGRAIGIATDVSSEAGVERLFDTALNAFGSLDGTVANAGISGTPQEFITLEVAEWQRVLAVNLTGVFLTTRAAARILVAQGRGGSIIATGSSTAIRVHPSAIPYVASKSAVHGMMNAMALSLAPHRIQVNTLVPGLTRTPAALALPGHLEKSSIDLPLGAPATPEEHARLTAFVLSGAVPHMTGTLLKIDSGRTLA